MIKVDYRMEKSIKSNFDDEYLIQIMKITNNNKLTNKLKRNTDLVSASVGNVIKLVLSFLILMANIS